VGYSLAMSGLNHYVVGTRKAHFKVAGGQIGMRITLETDTDPQPPADAVLISHMKDKYFICEPTSFGSVPTVLVIEDEDVRKVSMRPKP
jgi:hypothetical protein